MTALGCRRSSHPRRCRRAWQAERCGPRSSPLGEGELFHVRPKVGTRGKVGGLPTIKSGFPENLRSDATFSMIAKDSSFYSHERFGTSLPRAPQPVAIASACAHGVSCPVGLEVPAEVTP